MISDIAGAIWYTISKDDEQIPTYQEFLDIITDSVYTESGWSYFESLSEGGGGMNLDSFTAQLKKILHKVINGVIKQGSWRTSILAMLRDLGCPEEESEEKIDMIIEAVRDKALDALTKAAKVFFDFFGTHSKHFTPSQERGDSILFFGRR